jgi:hypothetical protein
LLGEKFGADGDVGLAGAASGETEREEEKKEWGAAHGWQCLTEKAKEKR